MAREAEPEEQIVAGGQMNFLFWDRIMVAPMSAKSSIDSFLYSLKYDLARSMMITTSNCRKILYFFITILIILR